MENSICTILLFDIQEAGNTEINIECEKAKSLINSPKAFDSNMWLLAYENHLNGWINVPKQKSSDRFDKMLKSKISFFTRDYKDTRIDIGKTSNLSDYD